MLRRLSAWLLVLTLISSHAVCAVHAATPTIGEIVTFTAVPDTGKVFTQFRIFDPNHQIDTSKFQLFEGSSEDEYAFVMIAHELIVDCIFQ